MKKWKAGALCLAFAMALTVGTSVAVGTAFAQTASPQALAENEGDKLSVAALERSYEEILKSDAVYYGEEAGKSGGGGALLWSEQDIDPDFNSVMISLDYTSKSPTKNNGYGFRFTLRDRTTGELKHVTTIRLKFRVTIVQYDRNVTLGGGNVQAKFYADDYFKEVGESDGKKLVNTLASYVNTDEYDTLLTTADNQNVKDKENNDNNGKNIISTDLLAAYGTAVAGVETTTTNIALRKVTKEGGTEQFRYYENGQYIFAVEFKDEVIGYAPNLSNPSDENFIFEKDSYDVQLGNDSYEYIAELDKRPEATGVQLEVGETVAYYYYDLKYFYNGTHYPMISFSYKDQSGPAVCASRYGERVALESLGRYNQITNKEANKNVYLKQDGTERIFTVNGTTNGNNLRSGSEFGTAVGGTSNHSDGTLEKKNHITFKITREANTTYDQVEYAVYKLEESIGNDKVPQTYYEIGEVGFPVSEIDAGGVHIYGRMVNAWKGCVTYAERPATLQTALDALKGDTEKPTEVEFSEHYADTTGSSVRFITATQGLRFKATIAKETLEGYKAIYGADKVSFGVKLVRASDNAYAYIEAVNKTPTATGGYTFNGVVSNIAKEHYATQYTPYVYIKYTDGTGDHYVLTAAGAAKSIREVAQAMLDDHKTEKDDTYKYEVTIGGQTVWSRYTQFQITVLEKYTATD